MKPRSLSRARSLLGIALGWFALVLMTIASPATAFANVGEAYGFGSRSAALAGADAAWGFEGYASYANPAGLGLYPQSLALDSSDPEKLASKRLMLSWGLLLMAPNFTPIQNVVTKNQFTSAPTPTTSGDVDTSYRTTFGQALGIAYRAAPEFYNLTIGLTGFIPISQLAYIDTGEPLIPEYVMYRSRTQRPQFELGAGADLGRGYHVGAGVHLGYAMTGDAEVLLQNNSTTTSTMRFSASLKPKASVYGGFLFTPPTDPGKYSIGVVVRAPLTSDNLLNLNSGARAFGSLATLGFTFQAESALYYDPPTLELGTSWRHADNARLYAQVDYEVWHSFHAPALRIENPDTTECSGGGPCGIVIEPSLLPSFQYSNIFIPKIAEEVTWGNITYRIGYSYRPGILQGIPNDFGNYLDPDKHVITVGAGFKFKHFLSFDAPCTVDVHFAYEQLISKHVDKTAGNEVGNAGDQKIGAPGYDMGGKVYGGGFSFSLAI